MFTFKTVTVDASGNIIQTAEKIAQSQEEELAPNIVLEMVLIPGGSFIMGSPENELGRNWYQVWDQSLDGFNIEGPQHEVKVPDFWISKYPVTQSQWRAVADLPEIDISLNSDPAYFKGDHHPIEQVSWYDAMEFCQRLSQHTQQLYRLPTEAEWEYSCRAGTVTPFNVGSTITPDLANYAPIEGEHNGFQWSGVYLNGPKGLYRQQTTEVGTFSPNAFGLYDMHGNVWEWCLDDWHPTYQGSPTDGSAWLSPDVDKKILRGGSWFFFPDLCRSAFRNRRTPDTRLNRIGFRLVGLKQKSSPNQA